MLNYNENRTYTQGRTEMGEIGIDKGQTQNTRRSGGGGYMRKCNCGEEMQR